jgi:dynactin complex subunit
LENISAPQQQSSGSKQQQIDRLLTENNRLKDALASKDNVIAELRAELDALKSSATIALGKLVRLASELQLSF